ncbi:MAG: M28 family peptidase, partial [Saprospiraceae bacterium]|nr:M28 family peptidase [Saprospiraceae bacterium]
GVSALFSIARHLKTKKLNSNILFVAFSGEEFGLWGSKYLIDHLPVDRDDIRFMINLDMVGRLSPEDELVVNGTGTSSIWDEVLEKANINTDLQLIKKESGSGPSDHSVFYRDSMAVLALFTGQHEDYHKATDDAHKLNYKGLARITRLTANIVALADAYQDIDYIKTKDEQQERMDFKVTFGITPDYVYQGQGLRIDGVRSDRPAEKAGLKAGDIILGVGEYEISDIYKYMEVLGKFEKGQTTNVKFKRGDNIMMTQLTF